ncbi:MAG: hypothetical protein AAB401_08625, partial [Acidobacteriota bacterium]
MRILKIVAVLIFTLSAFAPIVAPRITALKSALAETAEAGQKGKDQKADLAQYVGSDSCAECHGAEATHY